MNDSGLLYPQTAIMFVYQNIQHYHAALQNGEVTIREVVTGYLERIKTETHLNAFVEVYAEEALEQADILDATLQSGTPLKKLHGVVLAIKDVISYRNHKITAASKILQGFTTQYTATALQFLLDEGAIVIGNCNCDEFAMGSSNENSCYGNVLNALDNGRVPGGSSGGSAVAVQARLCMVSLGSDTGGSVRQPADHCGIIGLKPGYGTVSRYGLFAYASSFDQIGIFGNSIEDVGAVLSVMSQYDEKDSTMNVPSETAQQNTDDTKNKPFFRFCLLKQAINHPSLDAEIKFKIEATCKQLQADGHIVDIVDFDLIDYIVPAYYVLTTAEASSNLSRYDGVRYGHRSQTATTSLDDFYIHNRSEGFGDEVKRRIILGCFVLSAGYFEAYYTKAQKIRQCIVNKTDAMLKKYDAILLPVSPTTAPLLGAGKEYPVATYLGDIFTVFANLAGLAGIALPLFYHSNNMPFGLQVMTNRSNELTLLKISEALLPYKSCITQSAQ